MKVPPAPRESHSLRLGSLPRRGVRVSIWGVLQAVLSPLTGWEALTRRGKGLPQGRLRPLPQDSASRFWGAQSDP